METRINKLPTENVLEKENLALLEIIAQYKVLLSESEKNFNIMASKVDSLTKMLQPVSNTNCELNYEQSALNLCLVDKIENPVDSDNFPNIIRMVVTTNNEKTKHLNLSQEQLEKIIKILE